MTTHIFKNPHDAQEEILRLAGVDFPTLIDLEMKRRSTQYAIDYQVESPQLPLGPDLVPGGIIAGPQGTRPSAGSHPGGTGSDDEGSGNPLGGATTTHPAPLPSKTPAVPEVGEDLIQIVVMIQKVDFQPYHLKVDIVSDLGPFCRKTLTIETRDLPDADWMELMAEGRKKKPARIEVRTIVSEGHHVNGSRVVAERIIREADLSQLDLF